MHVVLFTAGAGEKKLIRAFYGALFYFIAGLVCLWQVIKLRFPIEAFMDKVLRSRVVFGATLLVWGILFSACGNDNVENGKPAETHPIRIISPNRGYGMISGVVKLARSVSQEVLVESGKTAEILFEYSKIP